MTRASKHYTSIYAGTNKCTVASIIISDVLLGIMHVPRRAIFNFNISSLANHGSICCFTATPYDHRENVSGKHSPASSFSSRMLTLDCSFGCNPSFFTAVPWPRLFLSSIYYSKLHEHLLNGSWNLISVLIKDGRQQAQKGAETLAS